MKKALFAAALISLAACKKTETGAPAEAGKVTTEKADVQKQTQEELGKIDVERLKTATPATKEQLESVLPATIGGLPRLTEPAGAGLAPDKSAMGTYVKDRDFTNTYSFMIIDAAGADASKYQAEFEKYKNSELSKTADQNGTVTSEVIGGNRVFFTEMNMGGQKMLAANYIVKGRYAVVISGTKLTKDEAKDVISGLDYSKLPD